MAKKEIFNISVRVTPMGVAFGTIVDVASNVRHWLVGIADALYDVVTF
jgi:hypothetical protein